MVTTFMTLPTIETNTMLRAIRAAALFIVAASLSSCSHPNVDQTNLAVTETIQTEISDLMAAHEIPGMAVAISYEGRDYFFEQGVMDPANKDQVTRTTLFEVGSITKLFTATAATYAQESGQFSLNEPIATYSDKLSGTQLGRLPTFHLATHTAGGFPLQVPEGIINRAELFRYFQQWKPEYTAGTKRHYANPSIGLLGVLVADVRGMSFQALMDEDLLPALGMRSSYISIPPEAGGRYAWGTDRSEQRVRVNPGVLADEAYGLKATSADLLEFLKANLDMWARDDRLSISVRKTHEPYFDAGPFQQALIWERYRYPLDSCALEAGNSNEMIFAPASVKPSGSELHPYALSKTGSTGGFGAYVLAVPQENFAIVMLANRNYPNIDRVKTAHRIFAAFLSGQNTRCTLGAS